METILVATDGSQAAAHAENFAVSLAARLRARLQGLTVVEDRFIRGRRDDGLGVPPPALDGIESYLKARGEAACRRLTEQARNSSLEVVAESVQGIADDRIVDKGTAADLLVLGRDGEHAAFRTSLIGSTVEGTLLKTDKPMVVVPAEATCVGPILLAFDGSPGSRIAARLAASLAARINQPVHIFVDSKDKGRAIARFDEVRRLLGSSSPNVREISSTLGRPDVKIIDAAKDVGAGLIVMGAFGRNRITEYFLGSNAAAVVRTSPIAVLLAR